MLAPFLEMQMYAAVLAEEGSFIRAARRLHVSQSSLTRRIAHLENMVGLKIFDRSTRRLGLTAAGRILLPEMQLSLRHAERGWEIASYSPSKNNFFLRETRDGSEAFSGADMSRARLHRVHRRPLTGSTAGITPVYSGAG